MSIKRLLIANRGEIAIRIFRTARDMGLDAIGIAPLDDANALHARMLMQCERIAGTGTAAYLDMSEIIAAAKRVNADVIHPGYGFLSENAEFSALCAAENITFIGPTSSTLLKLSDKSKARELALQNTVPVLAGRNEPTSLAEAEAFLKVLDKNTSMFIKAIAGGGGRGMRLVTKRGDLRDAYEAASREAEAAFGNADVYVEQFMPDARHIEVQILGDGTDAIHLFERECSLQRRNQKIIEMAPAQNLPEDVKAQLYDASIRMAKSVAYKGLGTFEFLVSASDNSFAFMEVNPRIQVEHTVTEEILNIDLVEAQLQIFNGKTLSELGPAFIDLTVQGTALQVRVNAESYTNEGQLISSSGKINRHELPQGRGIRVESAAFVGWQANPRYDSLLTKVIVSDPKCSVRKLFKKMDRALDDYQVEGVQTSIPFLQAVLRHEEVLSGSVTTTFIDQNMAQILAARPAKSKIHADISTQTKIEPAFAAQIDENMITAPLLGTVIKALVEPGDYVSKGQEVAILEAMKMEHLVQAHKNGNVLEVLVKVGDTLSEGAAILKLEPATDQTEEIVLEEIQDLDYIRDDLAALLAKKGALLDEARPEAVAKRRKNNKNMIRENIARLVDEGSFSEYGGLNLAAQRSRHSVEKLEMISPADGLVSGTASVNGKYFEAAKSACVVLGYDYTVFAGTQGGMNHKKTDRILQLAEQRQLPIIFYGEGGGGRPGDTDIFAASTLDVPTFQTYARLSGLVPRIAIASGRCFAGNAALMGVSDILIATEDTSIGMGGPAMIEGGGLGVFTPEEVGPVSIQGPNGVIDIVCKNESEATDIAAKALSYFQGPLSEYEAADQRRLRFAVPENRLRVYDIREVIQTLADTDSVLELKAQFALGMITGFLRIGGKPMGYIANNPMHLGGAIDADGAEKAARHIQLCDAFDIPILTLCDTPGFMVGPDAEKTALVRKTSRLFAAAGSITVPVFTIILRKGYGLGAQAMAGGSMRAPFLSVAWPTGEMGPMGLEGAVRLGFKKELAAIENEEERQKTFDAMVAEAYKRGKAINAAAFMEIDDVIDPADSRTRLLQALNAVPAPPPRRGKKRTFVDTW